jgi:DNA helicase II / ATP-dependent DNA helicase PcrA
VTRAERCAVWVRLSWRVARLADLDLASLGAREGSPKHLSLLTLNSAKGCEYDVVMMVGMDMGGKPWRNETPDELRESRRLFYVGLTRARDAVHMLYSDWIPGRYGPQRLRPSPFVLELQRRLAAAEHSQRLRA